ncbi:MAG: Gfo/Idh/MocA family oxidoreductase [Candidatus Hydrogenedentota bacterium]
MGKVGFGIIGLGNIAPVHAQSIQATKNTELLAVCDMLPGRAMTFAKQYGGDPYEDIDAMLARDDVEAVSLCVPSGLRADLAEKVAKAGKHILCEKPLEIATKKVDRIIKATEKAGVLLGCIFQNRFTEDALHIRKALDQGRFGKLVLGDAYIKWFRSQEYYDSGAWRGTWKLDGGGALMNQGIHQIDMLLWYMGDVARVRANTATVAHKGIEVEDIATVLLEFKNGAQGVIEGSTAIWHGHPARVEIHGSEGSVVMEEGKICFWEFKKKKPVDKKIHAAMKEESVLGSGAGDPLAALKIGGHQLQIEDFAKAIQGKKNTMIPGSEGRRAIALLEAIYKSARTGRAVTMG